MLFVKSLYSCGGKDKLDVVAWRAVSGSTSLDKGYSYCNVKLIAKPSCKLQGSKGTCMKESEQMIQNALVLQYSSVLARLSSEQSQWSCCAQLKLSYLLSGPTNEHLGTSGTCNICVSALCQNRKHMSPSC